MIDAPIIVSTPAITIMGDTLHRPDCSSTCGSTLISNRAGGGSSSTLSACSARSDVGVGTSASLSGRLTLSGAAVTRQPVSLSCSELGRACVVPPRPLRRGLYQAVECPIATYFLELGQRCCPVQNAVPPPAYGMRTRLPAGWFQPYQLV